MSLKNLSNNLLIILIMVGIAACSGTDPQHNKLTPKEKNNGYKLLFNGQTLDGWHSYLKNQPGNVWSVENGVIALNPKGGENGDLVTDKEYQNFILKLEWKISEGGNSGIIFDVHEAPQFKQTYVTGPEMQVLDNKNAEDNKKPSHLAGSLYDLVAASPTAAKPAGQWNKVKIKLQEGHLQFWLNQKKVVDTQMWNNHWKKLVNGSKFKNWKGFTAYKKGHIALQDHGDPVWYRDIRIKTI